MASRDQPFAVPPLGLLRRAQGVALPPPFGYSNVVRSNSAASPTDAIVRTLLCVIAFGLAGCAGPKAEANRMAGGGITGLVVDATSGAPVAGAYVLAAAASRSTSADLTNKDGSFALARLQSGPHHLVVEKDGYETASANGLLVREGLNLTVNVKLRWSGDPASRLDIGDTIAPPVLLSGPNPSYTPEAIAHRVEGRMILKCFITLEGFVRRCRILQGLPFMDASTIAALEARRYRPATRYGTADRGRLRVQDQPDNAPMTECGYPSRSSPIRNNRSHGRGARPPHRFSPRLPAAPCACRR